MFLWRWPIVVLFFAPFAIFVFWFSFTQPSRESFVVSDRTGVLHYDADDNSQTLWVAVESSYDLRSVELVAGEAVVAMAADPDRPGEYRGRLPLAACTEVVRFKVRVRPQLLWARGIDFPDAEGDFVDTVTGRPNGCANGGDGPARTLRVTGFDDPDLPGFGETTGNLCPGGRCPSLRAAVVQATGRRRRT